MDERTFIQLLWERGHFWNPNFPSTLNVTESDLPALTLSDKVVQHAVISYQKSDCNLVPLSMVAHGRPPCADGDVGPATMQLATLKRCAMPDHAPPPNALFHYENPDVQAAVESYQQWAAATGTGSWPVGCDPERKDVHSTVVNIMTGGLSSHQRTVLKEVLVLVEKCEAEMGQSVRHVLDGDPKKAQTDVRGENIPGSVIGYCYFPIPNTCNQVVTCRIDNTFNVDVISLANLFTHEYKGHGDGLEHTNGGIMNPSLLVVDPLSWRGDRHEGTKKRYFGGEPIDPPLPPGPLVPANVVRLLTALKAGTHGQMVLGSDMGKGDYRMELGGDGPPPPAPIGGKR